MAFCGHQNAATDINENDCQETGIPFSEGK